MSISEGVSRSEVLLKGLGFFGLGNSEETLKSHWHALLANWGGTLKEFQRLEWDFQVPLGFLA